MCGALLNYSTSTVVCINFTLSEPSNLLSCSVNGNTSSQLMTSRHIMHALEYSLEYLCHRDKKQNRILFTDLLGSRDVAHYSLSSLSKKHWQHSTDFCTSHTSSSTSICKYVCEIMTNDMYTLVNICQQM